VISYAPGQIASMLGTRVHTVLAHIHAGTLVAVNVGLPGARRPTWRITSDSLDDFIVARSNRPTPKATRRKRRGTCKDYFSMEVSR
jgi:hypothetical protein